jgi:hypothetical protein
MMTSMWKIYLNICNKHNIKKIDEEVERDNKLASFHKTNS